jgi:hypothetical protein
MDALQDLTRRLRELSDQVATADARLRQQPPDAAGALSAQLDGRDWVLFCGAGISIDAPATAPTFLDLRDGVVLALSDILMRRGLLEREHGTAVETAIHGLARRADLTLPPEIVFANFRRGLGMAAIERLLQSCLAGAKPNHNHRAIAALASRPGSGLRAVITPNFDCYVEEALDRTPCQRTILGHAESNEGFPLFKPHGSLDRAGSIAITLDRVVRPLVTEASRTFRQLVTGRTILVTGYSGWDYDLFPLLVEACRSCGSKVVWLLHTESSINERVAAIQLACGERCIVLDSRRAPLLTTVAGVSATHGGRPHTDLCRRFVSVLDPEPDAGLALALLMSLIPAGVPDESRVVQHLCRALLQIATSGALEGDERVISILSPLCGISDGDPPMRREAAHLAAEAAARLGKDRIELAFRRIERGEDEDSSKLAELRRVERELSEPMPLLDHEPEPELASVSLRTGLRIEKVQLLADLGRDAEAEELARQILGDTVFPASASSDHAWLTSDATDPWKLHAFLGWVGATRGDRAQVLSELGEAIGLLWREADFWNLETALERVVSVADSPSRDPDCVAAALGLRLAIARLNRDLHAELYALQWALEFGIASRADVERGLQLCEELRIDPNEMEHLRSRLSRHRQTPDI